MGWDGKERVSVQTTIDCCCHGGYGMAEQNIDIQRYFRAMDRPYHLVPFFFVFGRPPFLGKIGVLPLSYKVYLRILTVLVHTSPHPKTITRSRICVIVRALEQIADSVILCVRYNGNFAISGMTHSGTVSCSTARDDLRVKIGFGRSTVGGVCKLGASLQNLYF